ncbi:MAG TPA: PadR family transcriptional regulator [Polyangiales bacterium]|nr:PadR family transcriptional regulator [Polyangiales bacterium]
MFDSGQLKLVLLSFLRDEPRHGYDLIRAVEANTRGAYAPSPGVVYPTLTLLKEMGLAREGDSDGQRKLYAITPEGQAYLAQHAEQVGQLRERLGAVAQLRERADAAPIRRAMHNLKSALLEKLSGELDRSTVLAIAAVIDEAAQKVERL